MYKTVRHGENSLQYTILPQNDDFRIEGKLSSVGSNCNAATGRKGKARRPRRRSFFAYLGLIFVCTVIVGAVLIPFLVSAECLPNPTEWFLKTKAALSHGVNINGMHRSVGGPREVTRKASENGGGPQHLSLHNNAANIGQKVEIINHDGVEKFILRVNKTQMQPKMNETKIRPVGYVSDKEEQPPSEENNTNTTFGAQIAKTNYGMSESQPSIVAVVKNEAPTTAIPPHISSPVDARRPQEQPYEENNFATEVHFESDGVQSLPGIAPTIMVTTVMHTQNAQIANQVNSNSSSNSSVDNNRIFSRPAQNGPPAAAIRPTTSFSTTSIYSPHAPAGASGSVSATSINVNAISNQNSSAPAMPTITTRIMQLPLLKSAAKKPITPPVLVRTNSETTSSKQSDNNMLVGGMANSDFRVDPPNMNTADAVETKNADWIQSHWPYIDPSTYFQWTGYKEDSVLLPALLGFALTSMILITAVCLVARNKRAIVSSVRKRNRNDVEEAGADDNTTLLTNANLSDED